MASTLTTSAADAGSRLREGNHHLTPALLGFLLTILDQCTKYLIRLHFPPGHSIPVIPGVFSLTYVRNTGAAWGTFGGLNGWLAVISVVMLIVIVVFRRSFLSDTPVHRLALGFMIGGIVGNLIDRLRLDYVVDFLDFFWGVHHFPSFNVADSAICVGVGLYVLSSFWVTGHPLTAGQGGSGSDGSGGTLGRRVKAAAAREGASRLTSDGPERSLVSRL